MTLIDNSIDLYNSYRSRKGNFLFKYFLNNLIVDNVMNNQINIYSKDVFIFASENEALVNNMLSVINFFLHRS